MEELMRKPKYSVVIFLLSLVFLAAPAAQAGKISARGAGIVIAAVVSAASYTPGLAPGSIASIYGNDMAIGHYTADSLPLPTRLAFTSLTIIEKNGGLHDAPLFFVSPGQINFLIPANVKLGECQFMVNNEGALGFSDWIPITSTAPSLFTANSLGFGPPAGYVLRLRNGQEIYEPIATYDSSQRQAKPVPIDLGPESDQVFLILFGTGVRLASSTGPIAAFVGAEVLPVAFAGATVGFEGLDQVNLRIPRNLAAKGEVKLIVGTDKGLSNPVQIIVR
jgi:uncharacterized protein (TIGR03437 family)